MGPVCSYFSLRQVLLCATVVLPLALVLPLPSREKHREAAVGHASKAVAGKTLVRVSLAEFVKDDKKLAALRKAVKKMRELDSKDPRSWVFQANIHWRPFFPDYVYAQAKTSADPAQQLFRDDTGFAPDPPVFNQCPHGNWWFLPWHRAYLYYFERTLRWAAEDDTLTLPYWNYSDSSQRELPPVFRAAKLDKTTDNPFYLPESSTFMDGAVPQVFLMRDGPMLRGETQLTPAVTALDALNVIPFFSLKPQPAATGFASPAACDPTCGCGSGALERIPHNRIHTAIGGSSAQAGGAVRIGFMGDVATAARDPIFWLHHANIDRLWSSWIALGDGRKNPDDPEWLDYPFTFFDVAQDGTTKPVTITARELLTTEQLGYRYDRLETAPKTILAAAPPIAAGELRPLAATAPPGRPAHGILADPNAIRVGAVKPVTIPIPLTPGIQLEPLRGLLKDSGGALLVALEGIDFAQLPGVDYEIYLNLPKAERPRPANPHFLGTLTFFGSRHPAGKGMRHMAHHAPLYDRFVVPPKLRQLLAENKDSKAGLTLTFVPDQGTMPVEGKTAVAAADRPGIVIRQVRILLAR